MTEIKRWTDINGNKWACGAPDHSHDPLCRFCQSVDEVLDVILEGVDNGLYDAETNQNGEFSFKLTQQGLVEARKVVLSVLERGKANGT